MLCLNPDFFMGEDGDRNLDTWGYGEWFEVVVKIRGGKALTRTTERKTEAMFYFSREKEETGVYFFVPVYSDTKTYGFAILTGNLRALCDEQLYIWTRHMNQDLEQVRQNLTIAELTKRLKQLSVTDVLTGVYNRAGCEKIAYPMLRAWKENGGTGVVMLVDVNKMKIINDRYGHASGDLALCTVSAALKAVIPEDWIISRFGGDEFFIAGCISEHTMDLSALSALLEKRLEQEAKRQGVTFRLTISIGSVLVKPEEDIGIEEYLQKADEQMYQAKARYHKMLEEAGE